MYKNMKIKIKALLSSVKPEFTPHDMLVWIFRYVSGGPRPLLYRQIEKWSHTGRKPYGWVREWFGWVGAQVGGRATHLRKLLAGGRVVGEGKEHQYRWVAE